MEAAAGAKSVGGPAQGGPYCLTSSEELFHVVFFSLFLKSIFKSSILAVFLVLK